MFQLFARYIDFGFENLLFLFSDLLKHTDCRVVGLFDHGELIHQFLAVGGIDVNDLCLNSYDDIFRMVVEKGTRFRKHARGFGLGSGNSIAGYVPVEGFMAMVEAVKKIREDERALRT